MSQDLSLADAVEALQKALKASEEAALVRPPALEVTDLSTVAGKYLSFEAQKALSMRSKSLMHEYNEKVGDGPGDDSVYERRVAPTLFLVVRCRKDRVEEGVAAIADSVNALASIGAIQAALAPISSIDLAAVMFEAPTVAVFCYPNIKSEHYELAKESTRYVVNEGSDGEAIHSLDADLAPGEFLAEGRITQIASLIGEGNHESALFERIREYLKYLPEGTKFKGYRQCAVMDLSMPYELKFYNPLLNRYKRVELDYVRDVAIVDDQLKQFNLFTGMRYVPREGR